LAQAVKRKNDESFLKRVIAFMNELVLSREYVLRDLPFEMLEELVVDRDVLRALRPGLVPEIQKVLDEMDRNFYGVEG
jgi:hypothetical protein